MYNVNEYQHQTKFILPKQVRIREILRNYPEGPSVLKELLQNADDAGARTFRLCSGMYHNLREFIYVQDVSFTHYFFLHSCDIFY